jgi:hypothetical protein
METVTTSLTQIMGTVTSSLIQNNKNINQQPAPK